MLTHIIKGAGLSAMAHPLVLAGVSAVKIYNDQNQLICVAIEPPAGGVFVTTASDPDFASICAQYGISNAMPALKIVVNR